MNLGFLIILAMVVIEEGSHQRSAFSHQPEQNTES
jgi:hypothetical protein